MARVIRKIYEIGTYSLTAGQIQHFNYSLPQKRINNWGVILKASTAGGTHRLEFEISSRLVGTGAEGRPVTIGTQYHGKLYTSASSYFLSTDTMENTLSGTSTWIAAMPSGSNFIQSGAFLSASQRAIIFPVLMVRLKQQLSATGTASGTVYFWHD